MPSSVTLSNGAVVTPSVGPDVVPLVDHGVPSQEAAMNCGSGTCRMNGWQNIASGQCSAATGYQCITGWTPAQEPNLTSLAGNFAISDKTFSQMDNWSWIAHIYAVAGLADGFTGLTISHPIGTFGWGCDSNKITSWDGNGPSQKVPTCIPDPALTGPRGGPLANGGAFQPTPVPYVPTIMDELSAAGLTWHIYGANCLAETVNRQGLKTCTHAGDSYHWSVCPTFAECLYGQPGGLQPDSKFLAAATHGRLPSFSFVTPGNAGTSWHNGFSITKGDNWLGQVMSAIMNGPEWGSTAVFITWDDCGCFYDQVPPGTNPDGTQQGPRVPLVIVSPYARRGYTDTTKTTFAGILAYTEQNFGLPPLSANDALAYNFANAFNYRQAPLKPVPMVSQPVPRGDHIDWSQGRQDS
jgi:hypothetical protein